MRRIMFLSAAFLLLGAALNPQTTRVRAAEDLNGAIAYSRSTGSYGYSIDYATRIEAENEALGQCGWGDCEVLVWFQNNCAALSKGHKGIGYAYGATVDEAEAIALDKCTDYTYDCEIVCSICNSNL